MREVSHVERHSTNAFLRDGERAFLAHAGDEAETPTMRAPARRAERAWTAPMKPVPAIATRRAEDIAGKRTGL